MKHFALATLAGIFGLVALLYAPFLPQVSVDLRTTTVTNSGTSVVATELYQAWMTATVLWSATTMQVGGSTVTIPMPYTIIVSDVVRTYTSRTTVSWTKVTTATHSLSMMTYAAVAQTHPLPAFLLTVVLIAASVLLYLVRRGLAGEDIQ